MTCSASSPVRTSAEVLALVIQSEAANAVEASVPSIPVTKAMAVPDDPRLDNSPARSNDAAEDFELDADDTMLLQSSPRCVCFDSELQGDVGNPSDVSLRPRCAL